MRHGSLTVVVPPSEAPSLFRFSFCFVFFFSFSSNYELLSSSLSGERLLKDAKQQHCHRGALSKQSRVKVVVAVALPQAINNLLLQLGLTYIISELYIFIYIYI